MKHILILIILIILVGLISFGPNVSSETFQSSTDGTYCTSCVKEVCVPDPKDPYQKDICFCMEFKAGPCESVYNNPLVGEPLPENPFSAGTVKQRDSQTTAPRSTPRSG